MSNNLSVRRPSYFRAPSDTAVELLSTEQRRSTVPTLASLAVLDYRRHSQPQNQDPAIPDVRRDSLPMFYATVSSSRRESLVVRPPSPTPSQSASHAGGPHDTTPTASVANPYGVLQPTAMFGQGYQPLQAQVAEPLPRWRAVASNAWRRVRHHGRDTAVFAGLLALTVWNAVLTLRMGRLGRVAQINDRQLEDALIVLDRRPPWRTEL